MARFALGGWVEARAGFIIPWGTLAANILGSLLIGVLFYLAGVNGRALLGEHARGFLLIGVCGGFTTFSSFSLQTFEQLLSGHWLKALSYVSASVVLCLLAVGLGFWIAQQLNHLTTS